MTTKKVTRPQSRKVVEVYCFAKRADGVIFVLSDGEVGLISCSADRAFKQDNRYRITIERIEGK